MQQVPAAMSERCVEWSGLVYPLLLHLNPKLREFAVSAMETALPVMMSQQAAVAACLASDLKDVRHHTHTCTHSLLILVEATHVVISNQKMHILLLPCYGHYTGQPVLAGTPVEKLEDFEAEFYCPHALADGK